MSINERDACNKEMNFDVNLIYHVDIHKHQSSTINAPTQEKKSSTKNQKQAATKKQKKKWSKGKVKDKAQHAVVLDKVIQNKLNKDVKTYRLITTAVLVNRLKINGSRARVILRDLEKRGIIKRVISHSKMMVYTRVAAAE
ncbi:40S ribosomal protein S25 [Rhizina undulata]